MESGNGDRAPRRSAAVNGSPPSPAPGRDPRSRRPRAGREKKPMAARIAGARHIIYPGRKRSDHRAPPRPPGRLRGGRPIRRAVPHPSGPRVRVAQTKIDGSCTPWRSEEVTAVGCRASHVVDEHGNRVAVILPLQEYEQRIDLHDLAVVAERREEPAIEFSEFRKQ